MYVVRNRDRTALYPFTVGCLFGCILAYAAVFELQFASRVEFRPRTVVGGHNDGHSRLTDTIEQIHYLFARIEIEVAGRFVCQDDFR